MVFESLAPPPSPAARENSSLAVLLLQLAPGHGAACTDSPGMSSARVCEANAAALELFGAAHARELLGRELGTLLGPAACAACACELAHDPARPERGLEFELDGPRPRRVRARVLGLPEERRVLLLLGAPASPGARAQPQALVCRQLARSITHDMRSPLMAISGFAQVLGERHREQFDPDARRCLDNITAAAQRLERLLDGLSEYARIGARGLADAPIDLCVLLREQCAQRREGSPEFVLACELPRVRGDAQVLRQAFQALLDHAYRNQRPARPALLRIFGREERGHARLSIHGGCAGQALDRGDGTLASLPLASARRGIELHGGRVWSGRAADGSDTLEVELPGALEAGCT